MADIIAFLSSVYVTAGYCIKAVPDFADAAQNGTYGDNFILALHLHCMEIP